MYDFNLLKQARETLAADSMPFLDAHRDQVQRNKPYQGLTILHNVPLTLVTVFKIEVLALGGAVVTTTSPSFFPVENRAADLLKQAHFKVQTDHQFHETFDLHLDCCAELAHLPSPKLGAVELTQSGSKLYQSASSNYPVVSIDDSKLKVLETFFGTGDGFYRALHQRVGNDLQNKPFVVFGHGKVGRGIVYALQQFASHITVIDLKSNLTVRSPGVQYIDAHNKKAIREAIATAFCTITATGIKDLLTDFYAFHKSDFGSSILTNMGADDEYGPNFESNDVVFDKRAFNFSLTEPTAFRYLDPIFYSHNVAIDLILSKQVNTGYNPFPQDMAHNILNTWQSIYNENMEEALRDSELKKPPFVRPDCC
ncbi:MAG: NAD(P)-dependent oxidoreductase [Legionellaceae bacterium]|nr:NAD(P)-dependent oxidoreductase [Legionellaceae bacterium]